MNEIRVAILGVSKIATKSAAAMRNVGFKLQAVLSRDLKKAEGFKAQFDLESAYDDYDALLADPNIDVVYVGLPNTLHYEYAKKALLNGKSVFLEKPFTMDQGEALELKNIAVSRHLYLFETITTLYQPLLAKLNEDVKKLGPIHMSIFDFSKYSSKYDDFLAGNNPNIFNPKMGGGAMRDLGIYVLHLAYDLYGKPSAVKYTANYRDGVDTSSIAHLRYPGMICECICGKDACCESFGQIKGENGYIKINGSPSLVKSYEVHLKNGESYSFSDDTDAYENEYKVMRAIMKKDAYKVHLHLLTRSLDVMKLLDDVLKDD